MQRPLRVYPDMRLRVKKSGSFLVPRLYAACRARAEGESEMSEVAAGLSRFIVRKGAVPNTWVVWDRETRRPAKILGGFAIKLSQEQARELREKLTVDYIRRG